MFQQQQPNDETALDPRSAFLAVEGCDLAIDPVPVDPGTELHQLVLQIDDLIEPGAKQIAFRRLRLLGSHRSPPVRPRNHDCRFEEIFKMDLQAFEALTLESLQVQTSAAPKKRLVFNGLGAFSQAT